MSTKKLPVDLKELSKRASKNMEDEKKSYRDGKPKFGKGQYIEDVHPDDADKHLKQ
jgi:hypothetical protein